MKNMMRVDMLMMMMVVVVMITIANHHDDDDDKSPVLISVAISAITSDLPRRI